MAAERAGTGDSGTPTPHRRGAEGRGDASGAAGGDRGSTKRVANADRRWLSRLGRSILTRVPAGPSRERLRTRGALRTCSPMPRSAQQRTSWFLEGFLLLERYIGAFGRERRPSIGRRLTVVGVEPQRRSESLPRSQDPGAALLRRTVLRPASRPRPRPPLQHPTGPRSGPHERRPPIFGPLRDPAAS